MQKYRKFTDEATGVNPFIVANQKEHSLIFNVMNYLKGVLFMIVFAAYAPVLVLSTILPFLSILHRLFMGLFGMVWTYDDHRFSSGIDKLCQKRQQQIIFSNFVSPLDVFYYMMKTGNPVFVVFVQKPDRPEDLKFYTVKGLSAIWRALSRQQPFYEINTTAQIPKGSTASLKTLIVESKGSPTVIFYEGIRTNGLGVIKISKSLADQVYTLEKEFSICKLSYQPREEIYHNLVRSPLLNFLRMAGGLSTRSLKVRSVLIDCTVLHSSNELKKSFDEFFANNGAKMLSTNPEEFFEFEQFYRKTQKSGYVYQSK